MLKKIARKILGRDGGKPQLLTVGAAAPAFSATTHTGETVSLGDYRGRKVLLWFYPKADTPGCTVEGCGLRDRSSDLEAAGIQVLGVSFDTVEENRAFAEKFSFNYPLLCDTDRSLGLAWGACADASAGYAHRISYLIDEDGKIAAAFEEVNPETHPAEVLAAAS